jgi:cathepsin L
MDTPTEIRVACSHCNKQFRVKASLERKRLKCAGCGTTFVAARQDQAPDADAGDVCKPIITSKTQAAPEIRRVKAGAIPWLTVGVGAIALVAIGTLLYLWLGASSEATTLQNKLMAIEKERKQAGDAAGKRVNADLVAAAKRTGEAQAELEKTKGLLTQAQADLKNAEAARDRLAVQLKEALAKGQSPNPELEKLALQLKEAQAQLLRSQARSEELEASLNSALAKLSKKDKQPPAKKVVGEQPAIPLASRLPKLRSRGGELYYIDAALRDAFAKDNSVALPEAERKLPKVTDPALDWSTLVAPPLIRKQAGRDCWAVSAVTCLEWSWAIRNGGEAPELAVQPILDYTQRDEAQGFPVALGAMLKSGTCLASAYPYTAKKGALDKSIPLPYRAIAWGEIARGSRDPTIAQIKQALVDQGPVVAGMYATPLMGKYQGDIFNEHFQVPKDGPRGNHQMVIVGWDDNKGKGCWKIQNSSGPNWGDKGFMWIEYGCNNVGIDACWVRAQAVQYLLPEAAPREISADVAAFPKWPEARAMPLPAQPKRPILTVAQAMQRPGERVIVQIEPTNFGTLAPDGHVQLVGMSDVFFRQA